MWVKVIRLRVSRGYLRHGGETDRGQLRGCDASAVDVLLAGQRLGKKASGFNVHAQPANIRHRYDGDT